METESVFDGFRVKICKVGGEEFAEVFLAKFLVSQVLAFLFQEFGTNARARGRGRFQAGPVAVAPEPFVVEETLAAVRRGHEPEGGVRVGGEHGAQRFVKFVGDARGFVDQQERDVGEAANRGFSAGKSNDAGAVGEQKRDFVVAVAARVDAQCGEERTGFPDELGGLAGGRGGDDGERAGMVKGLMDSTDGDGGGLAPLAAAVEDAAAGEDVEGGDLIGAGMEAKALAGEGDHIQTVTRMGRRRAIAFG